MTPRSSSHGLSRPGRGAPRPNGLAARAADAALKPSDQRILNGIQAELSRVVRYDDESVVNDKWIRQRYDCGCFASFTPARTATVKTAWHEAGHAVAALAVGARFSSASIHHGRDSEGRVHGIRGASDQAFVIDAAGQIAERLMGWTMLDSDDELRAWLPRPGRGTGETRGISARRLARGLETMTSPHGATARKC